MTEIAVSTASYQSEKRGWLIPLDDSGTGLSIGATLAVASFTPATHYPNGYIPSGTVVGKVTATGLFGPYDNTATDGRETAVGLTFSSVKVPNPADTTKNVTIGVLVAFAGVNPARLPFTTGAGALDAAARTDLSKLYVV